MVDLIYQDVELLVVEKAAGMLSVPGRGEDKQDSVATRLQVQFADALTVHRLDMATSGLMVFARGEAVHRQLSCAFRERRVEKGYVALVTGQIPASGEIDLPIIVDWERRPLQVVDRERGKPSLTRFRRLHYDAEANVSRVELEPVTGRTHQLRVHLAALSYPIVGDHWYGGAPAPRLMLHACTLGFAHPGNYEKMAFASAAPF